MAPVSLRAQDTIAGAQKLAKQLSNPVASLISVPYQFNYDEGLGASGNGHRTTMNLQPVVPISIGANWNLISRTIIPFIDQKDVVPGTRQSGIGDVVQSFFFSPKEPTSGGLIWGAGPAFLLPTGESGLSSEKFAAGITGVVLKQSGPWTYGALANHLWDVSGSGSADINNTFFQPFVSYTTPTAWTFALNTEATYDWSADEASVPVNFTVTKLTQIAGNPVSVGGGVRYWADSAPNGPSGWGGRVSLTFLFPK
ncbi:hypothetical protein DL239_06705 [Sedimentitalea sp. CY04]|uniref:Transporter n=1 Tax=Parasedimentitalea denitrificans TaxID=2211118 RepID=A0ABX0W7K2_9RHOB|nr:hypothetical protein [Sedimentitalea sp. CY04]